MSFKYDGAANTPMTDIERIDQRLSALERAVVDTDLEFDRLEELATLTATVDRLEERIEEHERRLAELEGSVDAVGGFVGNVEAVNEGVERRADAAIAAVDRLEYRLDEFERVLANRESADDGSDRLGEKLDIPATESVEAVPANSTGAVPDGPVGESERPAFPTSGSLDESPVGTADSVEAAAADLLQDSSDEPISGDESSSREAPTGDEHASSRSDDDENGRDSRSIFASLRARFA